MSAILYGNLSVEIASRHGARISRMTLRHNPVDLRSCSSRPLGYGST